MNVCFQKLAKLYALVDPQLVFHPVAYDAGFHEHDEMFYWNIRIMVQCSQGRWDPTMMMTSVGFHNGRMNTFVKRKNNSTCS